MKLVKVLFFSFAILVLLFVGFNYFISIYSTGVTELKVPYLIGISRLEALSILASLNLEGKIVGETYSEILPGNVVYQQPEHGIKVKEGRIINLILSKGKRMISVPNLIGRPAFGIKDYLAELGLILGGEVKNGTITNQSLTPETQVPYGTMIEVEVANPNSAEEISP